MPRLRRSLQRPPIEPRTTQNTRTISKQNFPFAYLAYFAVDFFAPNPNGIQIIQPKGWRSEPDRRGMTSLGHVPTPSLRHTTPNRGAEVTAIQTRCDRAAAIKPREASGLRRVHRRFPGARPPTPTSQKIVNPFAHSPPSDWSCGTSRAPFPNPNGVASS